MTPFDVYRHQLARVIKASGRSRKELAARLGLRPGTLKSWIAGRRSPTVRRLLDLTELLQIDPARLFEAPADLPAPVVCAVCGRNFADERFYHIHVSLQARSCPEHDKLIDLTRDVG